MAVRDLLWGCPLCRTAGAIRPARRSERCTHCGATFHRGKGADIVVESRGERAVRGAGEWVRQLGPMRVPPARPEGTILGPEAVRVRLARRQEPIHYGAETLGWVEVYEPAMQGAMSLAADGLRFTPPDGVEPTHWRPGDVRGLQPASSSIQLRLDGLLVSVKFLEGSVRLWTRAIGDVVRDHHRRLGSDVLELQPHLRTCLIARRT